MTRSSRHRIVKQRPIVGVIDWLMMFTAVVYPLTGVPQAVQIFTTHTAAGVSLWSWGGFMLFDIIELAYGIVHDIKPLVLTGFIWLAVDALVIAGILIYQ
jgi:uncharacterized protein with PQ loop repeat